MLISLETYSEPERTIEWNLPLAKGDAFKAVNAAVFYAIARNNSGRTVQREEIEGGAIYYINVAGVIVQVFVLYVTELIATIRVHFIAMHVAAGAQSLKEVMLRPEVAATLNRFLATVDKAVVDLLRLGTTEEDQKPPPPPATNLELVFIWQRMYYPNMTDKELAQRIGVSHSTIRNARSNLELTKRTPRGKRSRK